MIRRFCFILFFTPFAAAVPLLAQSSSTTPVAKSPAQGTRRVVSNPLNDLLEQARVAIERNDFQAALAPLQKFLAEKDDFAYAHFQLGYVYTALKQPKDARAEYEKAIALDPKMSEAQLNLGILLLESDPPAALLGLAQSLDIQKKPEATEAYQNYLKTQPNDPAAKERLARSLVAQNQFDAAEALLGPDQPGATPMLDTLKLRADIQIGQKKWDAAAVTLKQAVALAPQDAKMRGGLGRVYMQLHDYKNAELELKNAVHLDQSNLTYWKDLGSTFYLAGNYPGTLAVLDAVAKVEKPSAGTWFIRALCYDKL